MSLENVYIKIHTPVLFFTDADDQSFPLNPVFKRFSTCQRPLKCVDATTTMPNFAVFLHVW